MHHRTPLTAIPEEPEPAEPAPFSPAQKQLMHSIMQMQAPRVPRVIPITLGDLTLNLAPFLNVRFPAPHLKAAVHALSAMNKDHLRMYGRRLVVFPHGTVVTLTDTSPSQDVERATHYLAQAHQKLREAWGAERALLAEKHVRPTPKKRLIGFDEKLLSFVIALRFRSPGFNGLVNVLTVEGTLGRILQPPIPPEAFHKIAAAMHTRMYGAREADAAGGLEAGGYVIYPGHAHVCLVPGLDCGDVVRDPQEAYLFECAAAQPRPLSLEEQSFCGECDSKKKKRKNAPCALCGGRAS